MTPPAVKSRAFTIIEMVIVLAVLGLIVGVTAPRFIGNSASAQARNAVRSLVDALTAQRAETIRSMAPSRLYIVGGGPESGSIRLVEVDSEAGQRAEQEQTTAETLMAALTQRGTVEEPFRILGVWTGADLDSSEQDAGSRSGSWKVRTISIEPTGRASLDGGAESLALVAAHGGDTIWRIEFDPISGVPSVRSE